MMDKEHHGEMQALLREKLATPRTVFFPGHRIRMNVVPMFLNLFIPWGVFIACCGLTGFWLMYKDKHLVLSLLIMLSVLGLGAVANALWQRKHNEEPTWYTYVAIMYLAAIIAGILAGRSIYVSWSKPYYDIESLKVIHHLDAGKELGQNLMDTGIAYFAHNNRLDSMRSWHFKHRTLYCVAPIVGNASETNSYDFWAVGEDCCAVASPDFRCGDWSNPAVRSGIRILDSDDLMYYRLAVQQAETLYGIVATHPVFFTWIQDPLAEINSWNLQAFKNYVFLVALSFVVSLFCLVIVTVKFAWIGRVASVYDMEFYNDPDWNDTGRPEQGQTRDYSTMM